MDSNSSSIKFNVANIKLNTKTEDHIAVAVYGSKAATFIVQDAAILICKN